MNHSDRPTLKVACVLLAVGLVAGMIYSLSMAADQETKQAPAKAKPAEQNPIGYTDTPYLPDGKWRVHDLNRPHPRVITPGTASMPEQPGRAPSDAIVLFDGRDLSNWVEQGAGGKTAPPRWKVENGYMEVVPKTGSIISKEKFGDCQIHVEWATPKEIQGSSQGRGNSGILIMTRYEIQVLDSYQNVTYADGQAGAMYGQYPPLVNSTRPPGEWQTYDIVFEAPRFADGKAVKPAFATIFLNGIILHNRQEFIGATQHRQVGKYMPHEAEEPILLQNHSNPVRFRNVWVRRLTAYDQP